MKGQHHQLSKVGVGPHLDSEVPSPSPLQPQESQGSRTSKLTTFGVVLR